MVYGSQTHLHASPTYVCDIKCDKKRSSCGGAAADLDDSYIGPCVNGSRDYIDSRMYRDIAEGIIRGCSAYDMCATCLSEVENVWSAAWYALKVGAGKKTEAGGTSVGQLLTFVLCTWNAAGLLCDSMYKHAHKIKYLN